MSEQTNHLLHLFSKFLHNPKIIMAMHMEMMSNKLQERKTRTGAQGLLIELWKQDGLTNAEISELLDIRPSSVTAQVKTLEEHGFVERVADENDKRVNRVFLTEAGKQAKIERSENQDDISEGIFGSLNDEEQMQLASILEKLAKTNRDFDEEGCDFPYNHFGRGGFDPRRMRAMGREMHRMGREMKQEMRQQIHEQMRGEHNSWNLGQNPQPKQKPRPKKDENWDDF